MNSIKIIFMNSILNNKKIRIISLMMVPASMIFAGIFMQSYSNEEFDGSSSTGNYTKADFPVVSSAFQAFQRDIEVTEDLYKQMNSITKIDFKARLTEFRENSFENKNIMFRGLLNT
jgi:ABC-type enterochelin transport system permease subunit